MAERRADSPRRGDAAVGGVGLAPTVRIVRRGPDVRAGDRPCKWFSYAARGGRIKISYGRPGEPRWPTRFARRSVEILEVAIATTQVGGADRVGHVGVDFCRAPEVRETAGLANGWVDSTHADASRGSARRADR